MKTLLQSIGWLAETLLENWFPLKPGPSLWDLEAESLAEREAQEEVGEPCERCSTDWLFKGPDDIDRIVPLLEDIRNILQSSVALVSPEVAAETPGGVWSFPDPTAGPPQRPDCEIWFTPDEMRTAGLAIYKWHTEQSRHSGNRSPYHLELAKKFERAAAAMK